MIYEPMCGEDVNRTAKRICEMARKSGETVTAAFNEIELVATPDTEPEAIVAEFTAKCDRRREEWLASPECKQMEEDRIRKDAEHAARLTAALATAPTAMTFRDREGWEKAVAANPDPYGAGVIHFADRWARLMEARLAAGETIPECADAMCSLADNEGITGFMYGAAVSILAQVWEHGEALRVWHNQQYEVPADKPGTVNPAILTIGAAD